jgi:DNA-binding MarR family transcriptional regulator
MRTIVATGSIEDRRHAAEAVLADLARGVGILRCAGSARLVRLGISMTHFHVLTLLRHHDAMPMGQVADVLDASMSNATGIIDRMEERGLVERVRVPDDRRVVLVRPTQAGLDLIDEVELVKNDVLVSALGRLDPEQLDGLSVSLAALTAAVDAELASDPTRYADITSCTHPRVAHHAPASRGASPTPSGTPA